MEHPFITAGRLEAERLNQGRDEYKGGPKLFHHMGHRRDAAFPWLPDIQMAGEVRMLMRDNPMHEAIVCAGRDRILHLSEENARLRAELQKLADQKTLGELSAAGEDCEGDFEGAYDTMIEVARKALQPQI